MANLLYFALIGIVAGWLACRITQKSSPGLLENLIIGVIGSILGGFLFGLLGLSATGLLGQLIVATVGAVAFLSALAWYRNRSQRII
jgi:uncharacterized membrane protein YeaQ/YmgE (transglycosylase-associated protein family)